MVLVLKKKYLEYKSEPQENTQVKKDKLFYVTEGTKGAGGCEAGEAEGNHLN